MVTTRYVVTLTEKVPHDLCMYGNNEVYNDSNETNEVNMKDVCFRWNII